MFCRTESFSVARITVRNYSLSSNDVNHAIGSMQYHLHDRIMENFKKNNNIFLTNACPNPMQKWYVIINRMHQSNTQDYIHFRAMSVSLITHYAPVHAFAHNFILKFCSSKNACQWAAVECTYDEDLWNSYHGSLSANTAQIVSTDRWCCICQCSPSIHGSNQYDKFSTHTHTRQFMI